MNKKKIMYPLLVQLYAGIIMFILLFIGFDILIRSNSELYSLITEVFSYRIIFNIVCCIVSVLIYFLVSWKLIRDISKKELIYGIGLIVFLNTIIFLLAVFMLNFFADTYKSKGIFFYSLLDVLNNGIRPWIVLSWEVVSGIGEYFAVYFSTFIPVIIIVLTWLIKKKSTSHNTTVHNINQTKLGEH